MRSRSSSLAPCTLPGMMAESIGMASIRSSWAIVRSVTIDGAVSPVPSASRRMSALACMKAGYARSRSTNASSRSGVSTGWNEVSWGRSCWGPPIWSTTRS